MARTTNKQDIMKANKGDKVVCVKKEGNIFITIGKIYEVMGITVDDHFYFILNDIGSGFCPYHIECFMKLNEWREQQINKIL